MYTGSLPELSVSELLSVYRKADYIGIMECCSACLVALCALKPHDLSVDDAVQLGYSELMPEHMRTAQVQQLCLAALLHHLGNVVVVMNSAKLKQEWLLLPYAALLDLQGSDDLATDSEDSVLSAVSVWADSNNLSIQQARQLLETVRLLQLSRAFFCAVLPQIEWVHDAEAVSSSELLRVAGYAGTDDTGKKLYCDPAMPALPRAWLATAKRPSPKRTAMQAAKMAFVFPKAQIQESLVKLQAAASEEEKDRHANIEVQASQYQFAHGFKVFPSLNVEIAAGHLGVFVNCEPFANLNSGNVLWRLQCSVTLEVPGQHGVKKSFDGGTCLACGTGWHDVFKFPADKPITDIASWEQLLLADGQLRVRLKVKPSSDRLLPAA